MKKKLKYLDSEPKSQLNYVHVRPLCIPSLRIKRNKKLNEETSNKLNIVRKRQQIYPNAARRTNVVILGNKILQIKRKYLEELIVAFHVKNAHKVANSMKIIDICM